jgi:two-component system nitrogen regulation response regulator NtrX
VILSGDRITLDDLPAEGRIRDTPALQDAAAAAKPAAAAPLALELPSGESRPTLREFRDRAEADYILATLREFDWNISRASVVLGVERTNLHKKMRALGIRREGMNLDEA